VVQVDGEPDGTRRDAVLVVLYLFGFGPLPRPAQQGTAEGALEPEDGHMDSLIV
jgi:hypothetical protein